jgi:hypothetical protein
MLGLAHQFNPAHHGGSGIGGIGIVLIILLIILIVKD